MNVFLEVREFKEVIARCVRLEVKAECVVAIPQNDNPAVHARAAGLL